jgi:tetrapyrrole methylase family protein/MazG family protein
MSENQEFSKLLNKKRYDFEDLLNIMQILRSGNGCPWDREQDHHSIRTCLIEETYEVAEAIDTENPSLLREELGDLLFQIVFHAQIENEQNRFTMADVVDEISRKMIHRHPHVFGTVSVRDSDEVLSNWESIKTEEKQRNTLEEKLRAIPPMMPALMRASKVGKKAGQATGESVTTLLEGMRSQLESLYLSAPQSSEEKEEAIGALLMRVTDLSRLLGVDAEYALAKETDRLIDRIAAQDETQPS